MPKLLIVSYYGLREALLLASIAFEKLGYEVIDYPLMKYSSDINDKIPNYIDHFKNYIQLQNPDILSKYPNLC